MIVLMALEMTRNTKITIKYIYLIIFKTIFTEIQITLFTIIRDRRQKTFGFLSRLCLLRGGGGQDKSAKKCQFPDESLLF